MKRIVLPVLLTGALLCGGTAYAHHSFASTYDQSQVSLDGEVLQFVYRNPHALLQVQAPDANRQMQRWTVEWEARGQLDPMRKVFASKKGDRARTQRPKGASILIMNRAQPAPTHASGETKLIEPLRIIILNAQRQHLWLPGRSRQFISVEQLEHRLHSFRAFDAMLSIDSLPTEKEPLKIRE